MSALCSSAQQFVVLSVRSNWTHQFQFSSRPFRSFVMTDNSRLWSAFVLQHCMCLIFRCGWCIDNAVVPYTLSWLFMLCITGRVHCNLTFLLYPRYGCLLLGTCLVLHQVIHTPLSMRTKTGSTRLIFTALCTSCKAHARIAKRGIAIQAIVSRPSVCLSVTLTYRGHRLD